MSIAVSKRIVSLQGSETADPVRRQWWTSMMLNSYGMNCRLGPAALADNIIQQSSLGPLLTLDLRMANQRVSPSLQERAVWHGDHLFLKVVQRGSLSFEQNGMTRTFGPNSLLVTDPLHRYAETFNEPTSVAVVRLSKDALRVRGLPHSFHNIHGADLSSPDVEAIRDFALMLVRHQDAVSNELGNRISQQFLDLMDVVLNDGAKSGRPRSSAAALALRAKQVIMRHARNPDLDLSWIARELNVSPNYLTRAFKTMGKTPMRYLTSVRLGLATRLLVEPNAKVKEVAFQSGFASSSHFCSVFKREFDMSPLEFASTRRTQVVSGNDNPARSD